MPTARTSVLTYVISGLTAAFAGMLLTGYSGQAYLGMGDAYLFTSIAAVAIGGASILGGSGHYLGTVAGAMVLTILTGLLPALNLSSGALLIVYGAVILITVSIGSEAFAGIGGKLRKNKSKGPREFSMVEITCVVDARAELGEGTLWDPKAGVLWWIDIWQKLIHRYDPGVGQGRDVRGAGISRLPRPAREGRPGADHGQRLPFLRPGDRRVRGDRRSGSAYAGDPLQRRQARPAGPVLVGLDVRGAGQADRIRRRALPDGSGSLGAQDDRGRRLLQRAGLQPGQQDHVFLRQPFRPRRRL